MADLFSDSEKMLDSLMDAFLGGRGGVGNFPQRQQLSNETYLVIVSFWNDIVKILDSAGGKKADLSPGGEVDQLFEEYRKKFQDIYDQFNVGETYDQFGLLEKWGYSIGKQLHRTLANQNSYHRELEFELEKFWDRFFSLVRAEEKAFEKQSDDQISFEMVRNNSANLIRESLLELEKQESEDPDHRPASQDLYRYYLKELNSRIGEQVNSSDAFQISRTVAKRITPKYANDLAQKLGETISGEEILKLSVGYNSLLGVLMFYNYRMIWEALVQYEHDYRQLCGLPAPDKVTDPDEFYIIKKFQPDQDPKPLIQELVPFLDPEGKSTEESNRIISLAVRMGGVPRWAVKMKPYRERAISVFVHQVRRAIASYNLLRKEIKTEKSELAAAITDKLSEIINTNLALKEEKLIENSVFIRLSQNLDLDTIQDLTGTITYASTYIGADIAHLLSIQYKLVLTESFISGMDFFVDYIAKNFGDVLPQQIVQILKEEFAKLWKWGELDQDVYKPGPIDPDKEPPYAYNMEDTGFEGNTINKAVTDFFSELTLVMGKEIFRLVQEGASGTDSSDTAFEEMLFSHLGISRQQILNEIIEELRSQYLAMEIRSFRIHFEELLVKELSGTLPFPPFVPDTEKVDFVTRLVSFIRAQIMETIKSQTVLHITGDYLKSFLPDIPGEWQEPEAFRPFIYFQNLEFNMLEKVGFENGGIDFTHLSEIREFTRDSMKAYLKSEVPNQLIRLYPNIRLADEFNSNIQYDLSSFFGVVATLFRGVREIIVRKEQTGGINR